MPLTRGRDEFFSTLNGVSFLMEDGNVEVRCRAVREMLRDRFGSDNDEADAEAFKAHREEIERAASDKYDASKFEVGTDVLMVVTGYDMASPLSQKIAIVQEFHRRFLFAALPHQRKKPDTAFANAKISRGKRHL